MIEGVVFIIIGGGLIISVVYSLVRLKNASRQEQLEKVGEWLLWAVTLAEREYGGSMGKIKLREVYSQFVQTWPRVAEWISFTVFAGMVDKALVRMRNMLETNKTAQNFVENGGAV